MTPVPLPVLILGSASPGWWCWSGRWGEKLGGRRREGAGRCQGTCPCAVYISPSEKSTKGQETASGGTLESGPTEISPLNF